MQRIVTGQSVILQLYQGGCTVFL